MEVEFFEKEFLRTVYELKQTVKRSKSADTKGMSEYQKGLHKGAELHATELLIAMQSKVITLHYGWDKFNYEED